MCGSMSYKNYTISVSYTHLDVYKRQNMSNGIKMKDMAYSVIKNKILSNVFEPGEYLEEKMLCQLVGVSRTPIRESINQLESEGFVVTKPNKGIFVTTIDIRKSMELFEARYYLEPIVLELSWKYMQVENLKEFKKKIEVSLRNKDYMALNEIDYEFHNYIHEHCNNLSLIHIFKVLMRWNWSCSLFIIFSTNPLLQCS